ncbi:MAG TPA: phospholipid carrier-dependent glycosyltransferase, partial [Candidatus Binataceae bacterium]|nr:phospholipid carrier-dependent glycosyltransferase [Candidatus Binataceae bacterium]
MYAEAEARSERRGLRFDSIRPRVIEWMRTGGIVVVIVTAVGFVLRIWRLDAPPNPVYDENTVLQQAGSYARGWPYFLSLQPPLAKLIVAGSVRIFGNNPWGWRIPSVFMGTALIPLAYAIALRALKS